jgi:hypothetical protein
VRALLLVAALALAGAAPAAGAPRLVKIGDFPDPVHVASPPGDERVFVVEQRGVVRIAGGGTFLDLRSETMLNLERGLLSIAFPPDYATSGRFYVFLTSRPSGDVEVREYRRSAATNRAHPRPLRTLLKETHPATNHNGGQLQFGPDGLLWASVGDAADSFKAQDPASRLGKLLRIDPATGSVETWATGLRNPWRFTFDRATGDLLIGDVGQSTWEEVDWAPAATGLGRGANYGWPCREGGAASAGCDGAFTEPAFSRAHADGFSALIGGYVVRDPGLPTLNGRYLYGDGGLDRLRSVVLPDTDDRVEPLHVDMVTSFGEDACGRIYAASLGSDAVYRLQDGAATPCAFGAPPDLRAPRVRVRFRKGPRAALRCSEACRLTVTARGQRARRRSLKAGRRMIVRVKPGRRITVRAVDRAGNERVRRYSVPSGASASRSPL